MLEPPAGLTDSALRDGLAARFGLAVTALDFLPLGHDAAAWVFRARTADGASYFVKVRQQVTNPMALRVPRYLRDAGVAALAAPVPAADGALWAAVGAYALVVYPFVEGTAGSERGLTPEQWTALGTTLRQVHDTLVPPELAAAMRRETFTPYGAAMVRKLDADLQGPDPVDAEAQWLARLWRERRSIIRTLVERAGELGQQLARQSPPSVLCHADIHVANVLVDTDGQLWIVDWDETALAPRERDLMFVLGGGIGVWPIGQRDEDWFFEGYGRAEVDPLALAYYRYAWAVNDIAEFGEQVCFRPDLGEASRREAVELCMSLFAPGQIVDIAVASELPPAGRERGQP